MLDYIDGWQWVAAVATWLITLALSVIVGSWVVPWVLRRAGRGDLPWARYKPPVYPQALEAGAGEGAEGEGSGGEGAAEEGAGEGSAAAGTEGTAGAAATEGAAEKGSGSDSGAATGTSGAILPGTGKSGASKSSASKSGAGETDPGAAGTSNAGQVPDGEESPTGTMHPDAVAILRGGAWLGVLERLAITGSLLAGYPYGIAIVIAIKGLGRYAELRDQPVASERFVVGTLASLIWSVATGLLGLVVLNALVL